MNIAGKLIEIGAAVSRTIRGAGHYRSAVNLIIAAVLLAGCSAATVDTEVPVERKIVEAKGRYVKEYLLMPGDRVEISVWQVPEVSRVVQVRPDGKISLPTVSGINAAGLTFEGLEAELTARLSDRLRDPLVTVIAVDIREVNVYVLGDVAVQRAVPLRQARTAIEAITAAGGLLRTAAKREISIIRLGDDGILRAIPVAIPEDRGQPVPLLVLSGTLLEPDDIVFVPEGKRSEAIRWLDDFVGRPLSYINAAASTVLSYRVIQEDL